MNAWPANIGNPRLDRWLRRVAVGVIAAALIVFAGIVTTGCSGPTCNPPNYLYTYPGGDSRCVCCAY